MLYGCDGQWWRRRGPGEAFAGLRLTHDGGLCAERAEMHRVRIDEDRHEMLTDEAALVGSGGNSGFQAVNLAVQFGATRIVLVGFDYRLDLGVHWHGRHAAGLNNPSKTNIPRWRRRLDDQAGRLADLGVEVLNASPVSALTAFPRIASPAEAL